MKRRHLDKLSEDDGMTELRARIHELNQRCNSHEELGAGLRALMVALPKPKLSKDLGLPSQTRPKLPEAIMVAPQLTSLPVELIENITINLELKDFGHFRQVCTALRYKSWTYFVRTYFTKKTLRLDMTSLRRIALIQSHSGSFSMVIKDLVILVEEEGKFCAPVTSQPQYYFRLSHSHSKHPDSIPCDINRVRLIENMLDRVFRGFSQLRSLTFEADQMSGRHAETYRGLSHLALSLVFVAIASNRVKINSLTIGKCVKGGIPGIYSDVMRSVNKSPLDVVLIEESAGLKDAFKSLKSLELSWWPVDWAGYPQSTGFSSRTHSVEDFPNCLLKLVSNVEQLSLRDCRDIEEPHGLPLKTPCLDYFLVPIPKLKSVELFMPRLLLEGRPWDTISSFKERCCKSLEDITIHALRRNIFDQAENFAQKGRDELGIQNLAVDFNVFLNPAEEGEVEGQEEEDGAQ